MQRIRRSIHQYENNQAPGYPGGNPPTRRYYRPWRVHKSQRIKCVIWGDSEVCVRSLPGEIVVSKSASAQSLPSSSSPTTTMSYSIPLPPPGMVPPPPGMPPPPPGMPQLARPSGSRLPPEVLAQKSQKWIQMQKRRYGEKRTGGYVDMGKQVCEGVFWCKPAKFDAIFGVASVGFAPGTRTKNHQRSWRYEQPQVPER